MDYKVNGLVTREEVKKLLHDRDVAISDLSKKMKKHEELFARFGKLLEEVLDGKKES